MLLHFAGRTDLFAFIFLIFGVIYSIIKNKLSIIAAIVAGLIGFLVYKGADFAGLAELVIFFLCGTISTGIQIQEKEKLRLAEENNGRRTSGQVIANGGVAAILGAVAWCLPQYSFVLQLMIAGSLASATADTVSSELGSIYGSNFYDILSFNKTKKGPDGVISLEGTLLGIAGSFLIAIVFSIGNGVYNLMLTIIVAGIIGNLTDSFLGATLERKKIIGNNIVNFLNTLIGALVCLILK